MRLPHLEYSPILALLELKKAELEYIAPVTVVLLQHRKTNEQRLAIYRNSIQQRTEAVALQRLFENQQWNMPEEAAPLQERSLPLPSTLPSEASQAVQELARNEDIQTTLEIELTEQEEHRTATQNDRERQELEESIQHLKEELRIKREESERLQHQLQRHLVEFLRTEEHWPFLLRALREAKQEVLIISPWMNRRACNDELCRLVGDAIKRGVRIRIAYGMGKERDATEAARNRNNVQAVKGALGRYIPKSSAHFLEMKEMKETGGTHQKILVCDRTFAVNGSFNWLSYTGQKGEGYRDETGTLHRHIDQVTELANIALQKLASS